MTPGRALFLACAAIVVALVPVLAQTIQAVKVDDGVAISGALLASVGVLATLSGATALVFRLDREMRKRPEQPLHRPWLFCAAHMLGSWLAAALCFLLLQSVTGIDVWYKLAAIVMASFGGARYVEAKTEAFLSRGPAPEPPQPPPTPQEPT